MTALLAGELTISPARVAVICSFIGPAIPAAVLVGVTVLFGGLAIRRLARHG